MEPYHVRAIISLNVDEARTLWRRERGPIGVRSSTRGRGHPPCRV